MPSLTAKDRISLCLFSFTDGRRCRTPRTARHPHFCFCHAQKETKSQAAEKLGKDLAYFFSGDYLSACDLNTALGRLIPAVIRGQIKPRLARTVACMLQTLLQSTLLAPHEYINAFGTDGWREAVSTSVNANHDYLFPPDPDDAEPEPDAVDRDAEPPARPAPPQPPAQQAPSTTVGAGIARPASPTRPARTTQSPPPPQQPAAGSPQPHPARPSPAQTEAALSAARSIFPPAPNSSQAPRATPATNPATQPPPPPPPKPTTPTRDPNAVYFDHTHRVLIDGKPW
jgi:hypothetical protein